MKRILSLLFWAISFSIIAQAPQKLNYQAIARDAVGNVVTTPIGIK